MHYTVLYDDVLLHIYHQSISEEDKNGTVLSDRWTDENCLF